VSVEELRDVLQRVEVLVDAAADARALHLDRDHSPVVHHGAVHLSQRRRGDRGGVELGEDLRDAHPQPVADGLLDELKRIGRDLVLEPGQRVGVLTRQ
jgi:hypothetical protein